MCAHSLRLLRFNQEKRLYLHISLRLLNLSLLNVSKTLKIFTNVRHSAKLLLYSLAFSVKINRYFNGGFWDEHPNFGYRFRGSENH